MAGAFDPYHVWLGIPPEEQPPNLYRLLGLPLFDDHLEAIEHAADQRMAYLRTFQAGKHGNLSQKLLNEIAAARVRLLNPEKKAAYDRQLRKELEAKRAAMSAAPPSAEVLTPPAAQGETGLDADWLQSAGGPAATASRPRDSSRPRKGTDASRKRLARILGLAGAGVAALVAVVIIVLVLMRGGSSGTLVFDWPEAHRHGMTLKIDGKRVQFPAAGPLEHRCAPGEHTISGTRPGYRPLEQVVRVEAGRERKVAPNWQSLPNLILDWPAKERQGANLQIDNKSQDIEAVAQRSSAGCLQFTLSPGEHTVTVGRLGYEPFERTVTVVDGKERTIRPVWKENSPAPGPEPSGVPAAPKELTPVAKEPAPAAAPTEPKPETVDASEEEAAWARYAKALEPIEKQAGAWDFRGAAAAMEKLQFAEPDLAARLAVRRDEVQRLAALKSRIIGKIGTASPRLTKAELLIRGIGGELAQADEQAITAQLASGKTESYPWAELDAKVLEKLIAKVIDRTKAEDWLGAGLAASLSGDAALASRCFEQARSLGAKIEPHLAPPAETTLAGAKQRLAKKEFAEAQAAIKEIDEKYGQTPWAAWRKKTLAAARASAKLGLAESDAERVYRQAADLYRRHEYFDLRPLVEKLQSDYRGTGPVTDLLRTPSLAQMEKAVAGLGKLIAVRQDGQGQFKTIQEAVAAAAPGDVVEIQDAGTYREQVTIPASKQGLTLRGKKGLWPILTSAGAEPPFPWLLTVEAARVNLQRFVLVHVAKTGESSECLASRGAAQLFLGEMVLAGCSRSEPLAAAMDRCVVLGGGTIRGPFEGRSCVWLGALHAAQDARFENCLFTFGFGGPISQCELRGCTIAAALRIGDAATNVADSIVMSVDSPRPETRIEFCNVFGKPAYLGQAKAGKGCLSQDPEFVDSASYDFRLRPGSPCRKTASGGGDLGFRSTPELTEMLELAAALRAKGVARF